MIYQSWALLNESTKIRFPCLLREDARGEIRLSDLTTQEKSKLTNVKLSKNQEIEVAKAFFAQAYEVAEQLIERVNVLQAMPKAV